MKLLCQRCGIRGSWDLVMIWYMSRVKVNGRERQMCLCPDCSLDCETDGERDEVLVALAQGTLAREIGG